MKIGFTGTERGMTHLQYDLVRNLLYTLFLNTSDRVEEAHHGDCVGADKQFHDLCVEFTFPPHIHPANDVHPSKRAHCRAHNAIYYDPEPALVRNQHIVDMSKFMIATPGQNHEVLRDGTWSTIRRWWKKSGTSNIFMFYPEGTSPYNTRIVI